MRLKTLLGLLLFIVYTPVYANELTALYREIAPSVVSLEIQDPFGNMTKYGTGFFVGEGCAIATNYHVIHGGYGIRYRTEANSETISDPEMSIDPEHDLAIIRITKCGPPLRLNDGGLDVGEEVFAVGNPQGLNQSLSSGIISGVRKEGKQLWQTTTAMSPGSSGGPLVDMDGEVVGVMSFYLAEGQNLNFAIPSQKLSKLLGLEKGSSLSEDFPDKRDPLSVAAAFFFAVHQKDIEKAISFVDPRHQADFEIFMRSSPISIPEDANLKIAEGHPLEGAPHSEVSIKGAGVGVDLVKYRDRWWITK